MSLFKGIYTAIVTPMKPAAPFALDLEAFEKLLEIQKSARVSGVVVCGTTGESPTLSLEEKKQLITHAIGFFRGSGTQVLAGTGGNNTAETVAFSSWASEHGASGLLLVTPYYNKPSQAGLEQHFLEIAEAVSCEVMLYNVPGRTGVTLTPETIVSLAKHPKITAIKEASGALAITNEVHALLKNQNFKVLSGDDSNFLPLASIGAVGCVSVASNLIPAELVRMHGLMALGKFTEARELHQKYYKLFRDLFVETNPVPIKFALSQKYSFCSPTVRLPLAPMSEVNTQKLLKTLKESA